MTRYVFWTLILLSWLSSPAAADTLRCGAKVILVGDSDTRVRTYCGEPDSSDRETRSFPDGGKLDDRCFFGTVTVEEWHYERGYSGIPVTLMIVDGNVERIRFQTDEPEAGWASPCQ